MENSNTTCPVCTLYLREGITLQAHLDTHPKEQVIEALLKLSNGGSQAEKSQPASTTSASFVPVQSMTNSNSSFITQAPPYINPQTQMTTAVTYQQFMTSSGSTFMPQYIQVPTVVNPNNNIPVISNQAMNFVPNQTVNYSQTVYNPLYNPYIPQPYPFPQPVFAGYPVPPLPPDESDPQSNIEEQSSTATVTNEEVGMVMQSSVVVKKCAVSTSTDAEKRSSKNFGTKKILRCMPDRRKVKILKQKQSGAESSSVVKEPDEISTVSKTSVIRTIKPKITSVPSSSSCTNPGLMSPPPLTLISGAPARTMSGSKTPPLPPLSKAPYIIPQIVDFIKNEDIPDCTRPKSTPAIFSYSSNVLNIHDMGYLGQRQKIGSVIVESGNIMQNSSNQSDNSKNEEESIEMKIPTVKSIMGNVMLHRENEDDCLNEPGDISEKGGSNNESEEYDEELEVEEEEEERQEKVFHTIEVVEENKVDIMETSVNQDIPNEISSENIEKNCDGSDIFIQQENILFSEDTERERPIENASYTEFVEFQRVEPANKSFANEKENESLNGYNFYNKEFNDGSFASDRINNVGQVESTAKPTELQPVTYTDLQPAKSSRVFQDLGLSSSLNFNNYMEVDGIKIFFNNNAPTIPLDPLGKPSNIQTNGRNVPAFMKTESQTGNHAIVDSVIHLVSSSNSNNNSDTNSESKNEFTFEENYTATTSQVSQRNLDLADLSPLALNIQADESMPARGELSEQESLGAENSTWNLFHGNNDNDNNSNSSNNNNNSSINNNNNNNSGESLEDWRSENAESVLVIGSKKSTKSFKCSTCNEVFSCPKERRVHKNTVHLNKINKADKSSSSPKKQKSYECSFCSEVFTCIRDRKLHVIQHHYPDTKNKKSGQIKEENAEPECINLEGGEAHVKNETQQENNVKTENSIPVGRTESHQLKYCSRCSMPFIGLKKLRVHLRVVHGEVRFKCESCSACFDEEPEYNEHLLVHPLVCSKCGKMFHRRPNLNLHMKRHLEVKPYECSLCPKSFITRQKLGEHMNGHSGKKPIKCTLCDKTFSRHSNLIQHRNLHHLNIKKKTKDYVCRCGEVFHSLRKLEWHKEVHEPKPKPCPFCSQKFIHSASVTRHIRRAHLPDYLPGDNREFDNVQCPVCEKVYLRSSLMVHMRVHNGEKPFACKICNKRFSTKWNLELHNWTHQSRSNMPFKCHICKSAFFREPDFIAHLNSHRNYKPFTCNVCGQKFIRKYSCLRHQEEHKKSKQFVCAVSGCAKSFHRSYYLRDHMKVHTGVRPHTCHVCGKASSTKSNHNKHVRIHDTREPVNTEN